MPIELFTGNNLKTLATAFADYYQKPRGGVFKPDTVIVQSVGMQRWLAMQISDYCGICANIRFLFPNNFFKETVGLLFDYNEETLAKCSRDASLWHLMQTLPKLAKNHEFAFINNYLKDDDLGLKRYQLCHKLADLYDQYAVFRPLWVKSWQNATPQQLKNFAKKAFKDNPQLQSAYVWQALLWQKALMPFALNCQWPFLLNKLQGVLADPLRANLLPKEAFVFGVSYLPPLYVDLLQILARKMHIYLFLLNPCQKYWGDAVTTHTARKIEKEFLEQYEDLAPPELDELAHITGGNRLLGNWGILGKQLFQKLWDTGMDYRESFTQPKYDSMLHVLQSDILEFAERGGSKAKDSDTVFGVSEPALDFDEQDKSLQIHVCHSPLREVEVLHDNLLDMFNRDPSLRPEDVVVIAPDINVYEPYINAVFLSRGGVNRLNFSISDKLPLKQGLAAAFFALLDIYKSRFEAHKILALLEIESVRQAFGIDMADLPKLESWLKEAGVRWGLSGAYKSDVINIKLTQNKFNYAENTWSQGLQRLLLACAMPSQMQNRSFNNVLSVNGVEFDKKPLLGALLNFYEALAGFYNKFNAKHTPGQWQSLLLNFMDTFFAAETYAPELDLLRKAINDMADFSNLAGFTGELHLEPVRRFLHDKISAGDFERGFLNGGITFCSAKPMRSIPFRVVCFLGMDLESFPSREYAPSFDLVSQNRRRGDRSKRLDDKYLFLEALVSAQDVFYASYTGFDLNDNSTVPPSVLVSELLETVQKSFNAQNGKDPVSHVQTHHKMHAFDPEYFSANEEGLFSYSRENFAISRGGVLERACFVNGPHALTENEAEALRRLTPADFAAFFVNPAKAYAKKRLNVSLDFANEDLPDREPLELKGLENYEVKRQTLELMLKGATPAQILQTLKLSGLLPHGSLAVKEVSRVYGELLPFSRRLLNFAGQNFAQNPPFTQNINVYAGGLQISGALPILCFNTQNHKNPVWLLYFSYSNNHPAHKLNAWVCHLLAQAAGISQHTVFMDISQTLILNPVEDYAKLLDDLAEMYLEGLSRPLPFFAKTGFSYAELFCAQKENAAQECLKHWRGSDFTGVLGESREPYINLCFGEEFAGEVPPEFYDTALKILGPFFSHVTEAGEGA